jgi:hypothetical protein
MDGRYNYRHHHCSIDAFDVILHIRHSFAELVQVVSMYQDAKRSERAHLLVRRLDGTLRAQQDAHSHTWEIVDVSLFRGNNRHFETLYEASKWKMLVGFDHDELVAHYNIVGFAVNLATRS